MFNEFHGRAVEAVNDHSKFVSCIQSHTTNLANVSKGQDICDRMLVEPDFTEVAEIANHVRILMAAVCDGAQHLVARSDVGKHGRVAEH